MVATNRRAVRRRVGVVSADHRLHLAECAVNGLLVRGNQRTGTDALIVQAKVLRVGAGDQQLFMQRSEGAQTFSIFFQTAGEALVGKVEQRQPAFSTDSFASCCHCSSVGSIPVGLWQQPWNSTTSPACFAQAGQQTVKVQRVVSRVVVGIFTHFQTRRVKHALVVRPAWVAYPHAFHEVFFARKSAATRSAVPPGLRGAGVYRHNRAAFTEQQLLGAATKFRNTIDTEVVFGGFIFQQILLCFFNAGQYRSFTGFIFINTNTQVDFARAVIGTKQIGQAEMGSAGAAVMFSNMTRFHCDY
jgi:hypothetical protein